MAKIIKTFKQEIPALTLVGKVYHNSDRGADGTFGIRWSEWFAGEWFDQVRAMGCPHWNGDFVGAMRLNNGVFEYWIGLIMDKVSGVPEAFTSADISPCEAAVAWIKGRDDPALYSMHEACMDAFAQAGYIPGDDAWYIERYACPRFTSPDENGEVILDYVVTLSK